MLPVTILTGFLGSGKTTLLRQLLGSPWGRRVGILMNERGVAGIDDLPRVAVEGGLVELAEGCVCCVDQPDLVSALELLAGRADLERIVLETSGLADPQPVTWVVSRPDLASKVAMDAVVTVVDVKNQPRTQVEEWKAQVQAADVVVLSKLDLASPAEAEAARVAVGAENPGVRLVGGEEALVALAGAESLFGGAGGAGDGRQARGRSETQPPLARHGEFTTVAMRERGEFNADALEDLVSDLPPEVFRAKGIARVGGGRWMAFQAVGGRASVDPDAPAPAEGESRLAFFGRRLERAAIAALVEACRARDPGDGGLDESAGRPRRHG